MKIKKPIHNLPLVEKVKLEFEDGKFEYSILKEQEISLNDNDRIVFDACKLERVKFGEDRIKGAEFIDVIFQNCDMSVVNFASCAFVRVEFVNCKLLGTKFDNCYFSDVLIKDTKANMLSVNDSKLKKVIISSTDLVESYFFETELKGLIVSDSILDGSYFYKTFLKGVDLSSCSLISLKTDINCIKGAIISPDQSEFFVHLIGLELK